VQYLSHLDDFIWQDRLGTFETCNLPQFLEYFRLAPTFMLLICFTPRMVVVEYAKPRCSSRSADQGSALEVNLCTGREL
jgi:hypothetical protein